MYVPTCDYGPHFWPRKKHLFYVAWGQGGDYKRYRLRFCAEHTTVVEEYLSEFELSIANLTDGGTRNGVVHCLSCGEPVDEIGWQVFVTGYPAQDERKDYWGGLHVKHQLPSFLQDPIKESPSA